MKYDFTGRERDFGRVVLAVTLNRQKMTECVIVGRRDEVLLRLERGAGSEFSPTAKTAQEQRRRTLHPVPDVYHDETRPLGSFLIGLDADKDRQWNTNAAILRESYDKVFPFEAQRWKFAAPVADFLAAKYESGEPSAILAAVRTWDEYLNCYNQRRGGDLLIERLLPLYRPFTIYAENRPWEEHAPAALNFSPAAKNGAESCVEASHDSKRAAAHFTRFPMSAALRDTGTEVSLWYPVKKRPFEVVVAYASFLPIIQYYLHKLNELGYVFQNCKICGKTFVAKSRHYELCGDECRRVQALENKREFDERAKGDRLEQLHENAYNYWYNRLRILKKGNANNAANPEGAAIVGAAFKEYRKEAVKRKTAVKNGEMSFADFATWLAQQQNAVDAMMAEDAPPKLTEWNEPVESNM
jgi:hypothetical protein